jgi:hypothetical protein
VAGEHWRQNFYSFSTEAASKARDKNGDDEDEVDNAAYSRLLQDEEREFERDFDNNLSRDISSQSSNGNILLRPPVKNVRIVSPCRRVTSPSTAPHLQLVAGSNLHINIRICCIHTFAPAPCFGSLVSPCVELGSHSFAKHINSTLVVFWPRDSVFIYI